MLTPMSLERSTVSLARAQEHWVARHRTHNEWDSGTSFAPWSITISREAGIRGSEIAHEVGSRLHWPIYDRELVEKIASEMGLRASLLDSVDERKQNWLVESARGFCAGPDVSESYVVHLIETVLALGSLGHCVIVGRGAAQLLPAASTLRVRLVGDLHDRVDTAQRERGLSHDDAQRWVKETDRERIQFVKTHFMKDPSAVDHCDLLLNTSRWSVAECAELIVASLHTLEKRAFAAR